MSQEMKWPVPVMAFLRARFMATLRLLEEKRAAAPRFSRTSSRMMTQKKMKTWVNSSSKPF